MVVSGQAPNAFLVGVTRILGISLFDLRRSVVARDPFCDVPLFGNDHDERASALRAIAELGESLGVPLEVYELQPNEDFRSCPKDQCAISVEIMKNILDQRDRRVHGLDQ